MKLLQPSRIHQRSAGVTLSEVVVVAAMIGVLAAIAAPGMIQFLQKARLEDALLRLQGALRETQQEAIRRSRTCSLTITPGRDQSVTGNCLVTGDRPLKGIQFFHSRSGGVSPWTVTFDSQGRNQSWADPGTAVLAISGWSKIIPKCLVLSIGIGLHRIGEYEGDLGRKPTAKYCVSP